MKTVFRSLYRLLLPLALLASSGNAAPETVMTSARMKELGIREFDTGIYRIADRERATSTTQPTPPSS